MTFNELNLSAPLLRAIAEAGYETPSPIQDIRPGAEEKNHRHGILQGVLG